MMSQLMTSSSSFKERNGWACLARARTNMKNTKDTVYRCYNSCEMFVQFVVSFSDLCLLVITPPSQFFFIIWKNYKIGLEEKWGWGDPPPSFPM